MATTPKLLLPLLEQASASKEVQVNSAFDILDNVVSIIDRGLDASKGQPGQARRLYIATDTNQVYYDDGATWSVVLVGTGGSLATHTHASTGQGGLLTAARTDTYLVFDVQGSNPAAVSGKTILFAGSNGSLWLRQSDGTLADLATGGGGGGSLTDHNHSATAGDGGALSGALFDSFFDFQGIASPPLAPGAGVTRYYVKSADGRLYSKDASNVERRVDIRTASELAFVPTGQITATDTQAAVVQLDTLKSNTTHNHPATAISFTPTAGITETNTQAAVAGLESRKSDLGHGHASTAISHTPSGGVQSNTVGAALVELDAEKLAALNGIATGLEITNFLVLDEQATHPAAQSAKGLLYTLSTDHHVYLRDSTGTTYDLTVIGSTGGLTAHGHTGSSDGGVLTAPLVNGYIDVQELSTAPGQPATQRGKLYAKNDHHVYWKDQNNVEYDLTATGGASVWTSSGGLIYPATITDRMSIGSLAASLHSLRVLKTGSTGTGGAPEAPIFVDQTITSVANPAPDIGAINAVIRYQASAGGGVADLASTGLDIRAEFGSSGIASTGTQHAGTFISDVLNSSSGNNEVTPLFAYARSRNHTTVGGNGTPISLWGADFSVHGPIGVQAGAIMGPVICVNKYHNSTPTRCLDAGLIVVTRQGAGAGSEWGHSTAPTWPLGAGVIIAGTSTAGPGFNVGAIIGNPIGSANANASPWLQGVPSQIPIGITMSGLTSKAMLLDGGNTRIQWGQDAAASVAWIDLSASNVLQLDGRLRVTNSGATDNGTVPLLELGANVAQSNALRLFNNTGALTAFVVGTAGHFLQGTVLGDVGLVTAQKFLIGANGASAGFVSVDATNRRVGIGTAAPGTPAILDVVATDRTVRFCAQTAAQFDAIASKRAGDGAFITDLVPPRYQIFDGTSRVDWGGTSGGGAPADHNHTGAGDGGALTNTVFDGYEEHRPIAAPAAPGTAGYQRHYLRTSDGLPLYRDNAGVDYPGSLQPARRHLTGTVSYDPPNLAHGGWDTVDVTCAGAQVGDCVIMGFSTVLPAGVTFAQPAVLSTNVVRCTIENKSGTNQDVGSGTVRVTVLGYS